MSAHDTISAKILSGENLEHAIARWKFFKKKIVFTNGVFDILHLGHIEYLSKAADMGDVLLVGLNSDSSVRQLNKGSNRPLNSQEQRAMLLAALSFVNAVAIFEEDTPRELILKVQPDILVKGGDYNPDQIAGADIVKAKGGDVRIIELTPGYSTTELEKKIRTGNNSN
jgi:D-glycero-beta-D-manno-heptose 1-phosphate adenylyltransferase